MVKTPVANFGSCGGEQCDPWLQQRAQGVEEPAMGIEFFCVPLLETKDDLNGRVMMAVTVFERPSLEL